MKRILTALKADVLFQIKQGFYYVYILLAILYLIILSQLGQNIVKLTIPIITYIDPSVLGLFFIGGMVLLEKEQGVLALLYVSPLKINEYMISKLASLTILSLTVSIALPLIAYDGYVNFPLLIIGVIVTSTFFTLCGFIIATGSKTVNAFFMRMVPWMLLLLIPCIFYYASLISHLTWLNYLFNLIPSISGLKMVYGAYNGMNFVECLYCTIWMFMINTFLFIKTKQIFTNKMIIGG